MPPANPGSVDELAGVAVLSSCRAWTVGRCFNCTTDQTLIQRWNGSAWVQVPSPNPGSSINELDSVAATSASNAWAVG